MIFLFSGWTLSKIISILKHLLDTKYALGTLDIIKNYQYLKTHEKQHKRHIQLDIIKNYQYLKTQYVFINA